MQDLLYNTANCNESHILINKYWFLQNIYRIVLSDELPNLHVSYKVYEHIFLIPLLMQHFMLLFQQLQMENLRTLMPLVEATVTTPPKTFP